MITDVAVVNVDSLKNLIQSVIAGTVWATYTNKTVDGTNEYLLTLDDSQRAEYFKNAANEVKQNPEQLKWVQAAANKIVDYILQMSYPVEDAQQLMEDPRKQAIAPINQGGERVVN